MIPRNVFAPVRSFTFASLVGLGVLAACSSENDNTAPPPCDDAKCAPGNKCLPLNGETKCRKTCSSNADPTTSCPFGYTCSDTETGVEPFCIQDAALRDDGTPLEKKPSGQWGAACQANLGFENPGCDTEQAFYCYGESPADGDAYCTRYDCEKDSDCGAGFWCGKINQQPNVNTAVRSPASIGVVQNVCLRRTYCSMCKVDLDCPPVKGKAQHCIDDASGARFCAPECDSDQACANEAQCADVGIGAKICYPRATVCVGDGSLCSPCRVDTDCSEGSVCAKGNYTTEKACTKKVSSCDECIALAPANHPVGCTSKETDTIPKSHCVGLYELGTPAGPGQPQPYDFGCWSPDRH